MSYAAVICLKNTINRLLTSPRISIASSSSRRILESAYKDVQLLQQVLKRLDESRSSQERMKPLEGMITEAVRKLEDVLEFHESTLYLSRSKIPGNEISFTSKLSMDLQELRQDIDCFGRITKKMEVDYVAELYKPLPQEEEEGGDAPDLYVGGNMSEMVGLSDEFREIRDKVLNEYVEFPYMSIVGMAGIGKTTLAKRIFEDPLIVADFECRAFVRVGRKYVGNKLLRAVVAQVNPDMIMEGDEKLEENMRRSLIDKRYLIVLDDVWDADLWKIIRRFPNEYNGSWVLVTTRLRQVSEFLSFFPCNMRLLNEVESWDFLRRKVFVKEECPFKLEEVGKKIAKNCEGLPLFILAVADHLSKGERTLEYWTKIAANKRNPVFMAAYNQISEVLYSSYEFLPQDLKACFLYMGAFPQDLDIRRSNLMNLWSAEGFVEMDPYESLKIWVEECLKELVASNIVMARQWSWNGRRVKAYGLHIVFWHLCKIEAGNNNFLHILNSYVESCLTECQESKRRFSVHNNVLFGIKDVRDSMESCTTVRSLLCTGPYHNFQVQLCLGLRLLRVLDALKIRFYEFPMEVVELVQLRYLALTCNADLPRSISNLWNLEYLIVHQHLSIRSTVGESNVPEEIWDLQELQYLQIVGRNLPYRSGVTLPNLLTLLDVGVITCNRDILGRIPNLNKLRVQVELVPDFAEPLSCFSTLSHLWQLKSLQFVVANPTFSRSAIVAPAPYFSDFTHHLTKLTLSGFGFPWIDMRKIAKLPSLQVLKLQCYAFRGEKWEAIKGIYSKLEYLLIEDTDLVWWIAGRDIFPALNHLTMKNCYRLREIPHISSVREIVCVDCKYVASAAYNCKVHDSSSW